MLRKQIVAAVAANALMLPAIATAKDYYIPAGQPVNLMTRTDLSTKDNRAGERFYLTVAENILAKGQVIIPVGSMAVGEIVQSERNGHFGKSGKMAVRVLYLDTPQQRVALTGDHDSKGKSGTLAVVGTALFVSALGSIFIHGTSGRIRAGTPVQAYLAEDFRFTANEGQSEQQARTYVPVTSSGSSLSAVTDVARNNR